MNVFWLYSRDLLTNILFLGNFSESVVSMAQRLSFPLIYCIHVKFTLESCLHCDTPKALIHPYRGPHNVCVLCSGACAVQWDNDRYSGCYHERNVLSTAEDTMIDVWDILSTEGGVRCSGELS